MAQLETVYAHAGKLIRDARRDKGLLQAEVGKEMGLSRTSIVNIEQGNQRMPIHVFCEIALTLGADPREWLRKIHEAETGKTPSGTLIPIETLNAILAPYDAQIQSFVRRVVTAVEEDRAGIQ